MLFTLIKETLENVPSMTATAMATATATMTAASSLDVSSPLSILSSGF